MQHMETVIGGFTTGGLGEGKGACAVVQQLFLTRENYSQVPRRLRGERFASPPPPPPS
mgnify:FL=1